MPSVSNRGMQMPESPIRKLSSYADEAKKKGIKVYHLNIGQPDIKTPQIALDAVKDNDIKILAYTESKGLKSYRSKLVNYYKRHNINKIYKEDIIITTGGSEALYFTIGSVADPGCEIITPEPFYANFNNFAEASSVKIIPLVSKMEDNFALPKVEDFEKLITKKTKAILICNPNNPTGYLYSKEELLELKKIVLKHDLFLIADEVYREFTYDGQQHTSVMTIDGLEQNAILIDSVSKRYSMCGVRIGCIVSKNNKFISTVIKYAQARLCPPIYSLIASEAVLDTPQSYFDQIKKEYETRRNTLISELKKIEGIKVTKPKGAFYCIVELPVDDANLFSMWMLKEFSYNNETLMVAPASGFYSTNGKGGNQIRIAYVLNKEDLVKSIKILKEALNEYNNS